MWEYNTYIKFIRKKLIKLTKVKKKSNRLRGRQSNYVSTKINTSESFIKKKSTVTPRMFMTLFSCYICRKNGWFAGSSKSAWH